MSRIDDLLLEHCPEGVAVKPAMAGGAERDALRRHFRIGLAGEIGGDQPRHVHQLRGLDREQHRHSPARHAADRPGRARRDPGREPPQGVHTEAVYGGASITMQIRNLRQGVQIVVATPGRLIDLIERKAIDLQKVKYVVLDEADEMLNMGFRDDIDFVLKNTINRESIWLFSATMPPEVRAISKNFMTTPKEISVGKKNSGNVNIDHQYYLTSAQHRYETLKRIIDFNPGIYGIIFTRTKADAQEVAPVAFAGRWNPRMPP